ncbi:MULTISPECIES: hypothetical protein [Sphingomonas]|jgi:hypothetical protein|uniref:Uncharacterized protein n=1 Tax=Sphingomonas turrisvirgatae TaxID=1888892 RepID=A0A1E3LYB8_9SPHN|nr:hypothetical protein [Sphingomonas turrisvirgatae]ODP38786.1 hypothetical protein BFL28_13400 [Sphingomonas turrisvirgatae]
MTASQLQDLLVKQLMRKAGGSQRRWRAVIGPIKVHDAATHAHCNWSVAPSGTSREIGEVERLLDTVRLERPIVAAG